MIGLTNEENFVEHTLKLASLIDFFDPNVLRKILNQLILMIEKFPDYSHYHLAFLVNQLVDIADFYQNDNELIAIFCSFLSIIGITYLPIQTVKPFLMSCISTLLSSYKYLTGNSWVTGPKQNSELQAQDIHDQLFSNSLLDITANPRLDISKVFNHLYSIFKLCFIFLPADIGIDFAIETCKKMFCLFPCTLR